MVELGTILHSDHAIGDVLPQDLVRVTANLLQTFGSLVHFCIRLFIVWLELF